MTITPVGGAGQAEGNLQKAVQAHHMGRGADPVYDGLGHDSGRHPGSYAGSLRVPHLPHQAGEPWLGGGHPGGTGQRPMETLRDLSGHLGRQTLPVQRRSAPGGSDGSGAPGIDYQVPAEALTDSEFAAIYKEAQKYVGTPYVWGGSTPETGFDCSGYVCWVYNQNGYNVGRTTANGLWQKSQHISEAEAKPGDLVFFKGTYDTPGMSIRESISATA
mgnify:CR=1 FL=1